MCSTATMPTGVCLIAQQGNLTTIFKEENPMVTLCLAVINPLFLSFQDFGLCTENSSDFTPQYIFIQVFA